jgi:hypothetical protein
MTYDAEMGSGAMIYIYSVANRPVAKQWLCKQLPLLGNARSIQARNNRTGLCNIFLSNGSVNTPTTIGVLLETVFSIRSVQSGCKEQFSCESAVDFRSSKSADGRELGSAREAEKMALWVLTSGQRCHDISWRISTVLNPLPGKG